MVRVASPARILALACVCLLAACAEDNDPTAPVGPPAGRPRTVGDLRVAAADSTRLQLRWTAPGVPGHAGALVAYDLRRAPFPPEPDDWDQWLAVPTAAPAAPGSVEQLDLADLPAGSTWIIRLRARSDDTWSTPSNAVIATAAAAWDQTPPAAIHDLTLRWRSAGAMLVCWTGTGDDAEHGHASAYEVRHAAATIDEAGWNQASIAPPPAYDPSLDRWTCRLEGLDPAAVTHVAVRAVDDAGNWSPLGPVLACAPPTGTVWRVAIDGSGDVPTIAEGVRRARPGDLVLVGPGRYTWTNQGGPMHQLGMIFVGRDTTDFSLVAEQGPQVTIIDAEQQGRVLFVQGYNDGLVISGFTITGGTETPFDGETAKAGGLTFHLTSTTVRDCIFVGNRGGQGGGVYYGGVGRPTLERCVIVENHAYDYGGGVFAINVHGPGQDAASGLSLINCVIARNTCAGSGGGLFAGNAVVTATRTLIVDNAATVSGGAVTVAGHAIEGSADSWVTLEGCTLAQNRAPDGAAVRVTQTVTPSRPGRARLLRSIVAFHEDAASLSVRPSSTLAIGCCDLFGNVGMAATPPGSTDLGGNFALDPLFVAREGADAWWLQAGSPCLPGAHPDGAGCGRIGARHLGHAAKNDTGLPVAPSL